MPLHYRTVFISDTHLGSRGAQARDLARFLRCIECERLYLVGDIIDIWRMRSRAYWTLEHSEALQEILAIVKRGVDVRFIPGNHDEAARDYCQLAFGGVKVLMRDVHETLDGRRMLITHGDQFDLVVRNSRLLSLLGSAAYEWLIRVNSVNNWCRRKLGLEYWSLAQYLKLRVKSACTFVSRFEVALLDEAKRNGLDGVICGHIHKAEQRDDLGIAYYNCGDWIESCTAVVEHHDGHLEVIEALPEIARMVRQRKTVSHTPRKASLDAAGTSGIG